MVECKKVDYKQVKWYQHARPENMKGKRFFFSRAMVIKLKFLKVEMNEFIEMETRFKSRRDKSRKEVAVVLR